MHNGPSSYISSDRQLAGAATAGYITNFVLLVWLTCQTAAVGDLIVYIYNRLPFLQISMFRSSSQDLVAASGQRRPAKPPGALYMV